MPEKKFYQIQLKNKFLVKQTESICANTFLYKTNAQKVSHFLNHYFKLQAQLNKFQSVKYSPNITPTEFLELTSSKQCAHISNFMQLLASKQLFEAAAYTRDTLQLLKTNKSSIHKFKLHILGKKSNQDKLVELGSYLNIPTPKHIECIDISHTCGKDTVAGIVQYKNYEFSRTFCYKLPDQNNDVKSIYSTIIEHFPKNKIPDLLIVDGGLEQANAAFKAFVKLKRKPKTIIGIAKAEELIYFPKTLKPIVLNLKDHALHIVQLIRDKTHITANSYHKELRSKSLFK